METNTLSNFMEMSSDFFPPKKKKKTIMCFIVLDKVNYEEMHYDLAIAIQIF